MQVVEVQDMADRGPACRLGQFGAEPGHGVVTGGECDGHGVLKGPVGKREVVR